LKTDSRGRRFFAHIDRVGGVLRIEYGDDVSIARPLPDGGCG
jgi:hypothetical protein